MKDTDRVDNIGVEMPKSRGRSFKVKEMSKVIYRGKVFFTSLEHTADGGGGGK